VVPQDGGGRPLRRRYRGSRRGSGYLLRANRPMPLYGPLADSAAVTIRSTRGVSLARAREREKAGR
jgi:hypothetical protein